MTDPNFTTEELFALHDELCSKAKEIMHAKNHDYRGGSGDPFANFRDSTGLGINPILGIMLRMRDKQQRIRTFAEKGVLQVKDEGVLDAIIDQINYLVLMAGMIREAGGKPQPESVEREHPAGYAKGDPRVYGPARAAAADAADLKTWNQINKDKADRANKDKANKAGQYVDHDPRG